MHRRVKCCQPKLPHGLCGKSASHYSLNSSHTAAKKYLPNLARLHGTLSCYDKIHDFSAWTIVHDERNQHKNLRHTSNHDHNLTYLHKSCYTLARTLNISFYGLSVNLMPLGMRFFLPKIWLKAGLAWVIFAIALEISNKDTIYD